MLRIIMNPSAGSGRTQTILPMVEAELQKRGLAYDVVKTAASFDATQIAKNAVQEGIDGVVAIGGDGTVFEVANGLAQSETELYIVSCGTGNDFIRSLGLPKDPLEALRAQLDAPIRRIDVGAASSYRFMNVAGAGFDVEVLRQTERFKQKHKGLLPYLLGILNGIKNFKPFHAKLTIDGGEPIEDDFTVMVFANGQYYGGGMHVARKADPFDGMFDVLYVRTLPKWLVCLVLPLFLPGWYDILPITHSVRTKAATLTANGLTINMDGELRDIDHVEFALLPGAVKMHLPK